MNKKFAMIGAGVVAGSVLLMSSVYAGIGSTPGYTAYKTALKATAAVDNVTDKINLTVEDNGKVLFQVNSTIKSTEHDQMGSAEFTLLSGETKQSIQVYSQDDKEIIKTSGSDVYQIIEMDQEDKKQVKKHKEGLEKHDPAFAQEMENVIDALVGNLKNYVTLKEEGDSKEVAMQLTGTQIPAVVNTIGSLLIKVGSQEHEEELALNPEDTFGINVQSIHDSLPKLAEDIKIESVSMNADVNAANIITSHDAKIQISGKDDQGANHEVVITLSVDSSNFNNTTPETIDLTGKKVEVVQGWDRDRD